MANAELAFAIRAVNEASRTLRDVQGDIQGLGDRAERTRGPLSGLGETLRGVGTVAAGFLAGTAIQAGVGAVTGFIGGAVDAAKDLGESLNAVNVVFGDSSQKILDWGRNNATAFGLSSREFNQLVTPLGAMLQNYGFSADEAADQSINLAKRAADMASVFNVDVGEALEAIQAGLRGESDPLEKFGVGLNAAAIEGKALAMTGKDVASALTDQEKKAASLALIMEQTAKVEGDFVNTSDSLANSQRIAAAKTEEMQAKLGEKLLPVTLLVTQAKLKLTEILVDKLVPAIGAVLGVVVPFAAVLTDQVGPAAQILVDIFGFLAAHSEETIAALAGVATAIIAGMVPAVIAWTAAEYAKATALAVAAVAFVAANAPMVATVLAIGAVVAALVLLEQKTHFFSEVVLPPLRDAFEYLSETVLPALITAFEDVQRFVEPILIYIAGIARDQLQDIVDYIQSIITVATEVISFFTNVFKGDWEAAWQDVKDIGEAVLNLFLDYLQLGFLDEIIARLVAAAPMLLEKGRELLQAIWDGFKRYWDDVVYWYYVGFPLLVLNTIGDVLTTLARKGFELLQGLLTGAINAWGTILLPWWLSLPGQFIDLLGDVTRLLYRKGAEIMQSLVDGILSVDIPNPLDLIPGADDINPFREAGRAAGQAWAEGYAEGAVVGEGSTPGVPIGEGITPGVPIPPGGGGGGGIGGGSAAGMVALWHQYLDALGFRDQFNIGGWPLIAGIFNQMFDTTGQIRRSLAEVFGFGNLGTAANQTAFNAWYNGTFLGNQFISTLRDAGLAFHMGGIVPGPLDAERVILARGGERITPRNQRFDLAPIVNINISAVDGQSVQRIAPQLMTLIRRELAREIY